MHEAVSKLNELVTKELDREGEAPAEPHYHSRYSK